MTLPWPLNLIIPPFFDTTHEPPKALEAPKRMRDADMLDLSRGVLLGTVRPRVRVYGPDYSYEGWIIGAGMSRGGTARGMVEDDIGRVEVVRAGDIEIIKLMVESSGSGDVSPQSSNVRVA